MAPSAPEVKLGYANAGRDTMAAIEEELAAPALHAADAPLIEISEAPAGRETMAAIAEELAQSMRPRQNTLPYGDRISNAPGARAPRRKSVAPPEVTVTEEPAAPTPVTLPAHESLEIFELLTFIVRGNEVGDLSTDALRRRFVQVHLARRLPGGSIDAVERIEVTPWTAKGTMVVRIWCKA